MKDRRGEIANQIREILGFKQKEKRADYLDSFDLRCILLYMQQDKSAKSDKPNKGKA